MSAITINEDLKRRGQNYAIEIRRSDHYNAFRSQRKRTKVSDDLQGVHFFNNFKQLRESLDWAATPIDVYNVLMSIKESLTSSSDPNALPVDQFEAAGLLDPVLHCASVDSLPDEDLSIKIVSVSLWILSNYFASNVYNRSFIISKGFVPLMQRLIVLDKPEITENALFCLANIVGDFLEMRTELLRYDIYLLTFETIDRHPNRSKLLEVAAWLISNSVRAPAFALEEELVRRAAKMLRMSENPEVVKEVLWALAFYIDRKEEADARIKFVAQLDIARLLNIFLEHRDAALARPLLRLYGYLSYGSHDIICQFYNEQMMADLIYFMRHPAKDLQHDAIWIFANIVGTSEFLHQGLFKHRYIEHVIEICTLASHMPTRLEGLRVLVNYTYFATLEQIVYLGDQFALANVLLTLLEQQPEKPKEFYIACLKCIQAMLDICKKAGSDYCLKALWISPFLSNLQNLQTTKQQIVCELTQKIISENFETMG